MFSLRAIARRLAQTRFGRKALAQPDGFGFLKRKPTPRVYAGLALMGFSFLTGLPALAFLGFLAVRTGEPMVIAVGGPVVVVLVHIIFGVGVYLAGGNYAKEVLLWATRQFLERFG